MFKYTLKDAKRLITSEPCNYYDYIKETMAEWREHLKNSETATYTFLADDIAIKNYGHVLSIKKYIDGQVLSWNFNSLADKLDKNDNYIEVKL